MALYLYVVKGPLKGDYFTLKDGLTIGRQESNLNLKDSKASAIHAKIKETQEGWILIDAQSTNGTRVKGQRIQEVQLEPKMKIIIGRTVLEVRREKEIEIEIEDLIEEERPPKLKNKKIKVKKDIENEALEVDVETIPWSEVLLDFTKPFTAQVQDQMKAVVPLKPAVQLTFFRGLQFEQSYLIGYGPRKLGAHSIDLPIFEPQAPDLCFEVIPSANGPLYKTPSNSPVLLNGKNISSEVLKDGDIISIYETHIEVSLIK